MSLSELTRTSFSATIGLLILLVSVFVAARYFSDQPLSPATLDALKEAQRLPPDSQNGYLYLVRSIGLVDINQENAENNRHGIYFDTGGDYGICHNVEKSKCEAYCCWSTEFIERIWKINKPAIDIFKGMREFEAYSGAANLQTGKYSLRPDVATSLASAAEIDALQSLVTGDVRSAYETTISGLLLFRRILASPQTGFGRSAAFLGASQLLHLLAHLVLHYPVPSGVEVRLDQVIAPHSKKDGLRQEMLGNLLANERIQKAQQLIGVDPLNFIIDEWLASAKNSKVERRGVIQRLLVKALYQPNDTANFIVSEYQQKIDAPATCSYESYNSVSGRNHLIRYNHIGRLLFENVARNSEVGDLRFNALLQLVRTAYEIGGFVGIPNIREIEQAREIPEQYSGKNAKLDIRNDRVSLSLGANPRCHVWISLHPIFK